MSEPNVPEPIDPADDGSPSATEAPAAAPADPDTPREADAPAADVPAADVPALPGNASSGEPHPDEAVAQADGTPAEGAPAEGQHEHAEGAAADGEHEHAEGTSAEGQPEHGESVGGFPARRRPRDPAVLRAFRAGLPVEGTVEKVIKGGYEVRVGRLRGFCPHSQMDVLRVENAEEHVGKTYAWRILQLRRGGEDVVVSRRALLEAERSDERAAVRATLLEGALTSGHVARIAEFGVFVDLGAGVTGLVHLTELSHARVARPSDAVKVGDYVAVKILRIDDTSGKISLSMKQAQADPWEGVAETIHAGDRATAPVKRLVDFGAFVEIRPGLEALVPARELPATPTGWRQDLAPGVVREWVVIGVDSERRRLTVLPAEIAGTSNPAEAIVAGARLKGRVQKVETFGVFVWLGPGKVGLMPKVWTGVPYGQPFETKFPEGSEVAVEVVEVVEDGKRIRLAAEGVARKEHDEPRRPQSRPRPERDAGPRRHDGHDSGAEGADSGGSFGTNLGDALKAAFERRGPGEA